MRIFTLCLALAALTTVLVGCGSSEPAAATDAGAAGAPAPGTPATGTATKPGGATAESAPAPQPAEGAQNADQIVGSKNKGGN